MITKENVKVEGNTERPAHVEWSMTEKPNENEKKGIIKRTARHEKKNQASYLRRKREGCAC